MAELQLKDPQALYEDWERSHWNPHEIDLARDRDHWQAADPDQRDLVYWALCSLLVAEERITTQFSALVMAYEDEEEESYLATQQVDEARHLQFYNRFQNEVISDRDAIAGHIERAREQLGPSFRTIFDQALVGAHRRLAADPSDAGAKVDFVTTYHMVIEGTLGTTAFHFITRYLDQNELLPGFVDGYSRIASDEQRHLAYGIHFLRQAVNRTPELGDRVRETLRGLLPAVAEALSPPQTNGEGDWEALGTTAAEVREFALGGLERRLKIVGVPLGSL